MFVSTENRRDVCLYLLATQGGGAFFGKVGSFAADYAFDAVVLDDTVLAHQQELNLAERLEHTVYLGLDQNEIRAKYAAREPIAI